MGKMADIGMKNTDKKLKVFRSLFSGLTNVYGTYDPKSGHASQVKAPVTEKVLLAHLMGRQPYGVYLLVKDRTRAIAVDFDKNDKLAPMEFVARAKHYGISAYIERSKSKGHHVWIFFVELGVLALKARLVVNYILDEIGEADTEIFPKQDVLDGNVRYGNFINAPLFGGLVPHKKTVFVDPKTFEAFSNQWTFLGSISRLDESALDNIIELNDLSPVSAHPPSNTGSGNGVKSTFSLPPCAQEMMSNGVSRFQRVSCFRLAVHLKRVGLPYDVAVAVLKIWALKNRPKDGKGVIRESEILSQTSYAYEHPYSGYGCESPAIKPFCDQSCPVRQWRKGNIANSPEKQGNNRAKVQEKHCFN